MYREPEFHAHTEQFTAGIFEVAHRHLAAQVPDARWAAWAASLVPVVVIEAVIAWLDAGQPEPTEIGSHVIQIVGTIVDPPPPLETASGHWKRAVLVRVERHEASGAPVASGLPVS